MLVQLVLMGRLLVMLVRLVRLLGTMLIRLLFQLKVGNSITKMGVWQVVGNDVS